MKIKEDAIDRVFSSINQSHLPGAAVGIQINGLPVYRKGFGLASMELAQVLTPSTRMRIYSVTKHFTCLAYMLLCEEGKAEIDDPVGKHFPEFHSVMWKVTMRQLMGNISGLRDAHGLSFQFCGTQWVAPSSEVIEIYRTIGDVDAQPASAWIYNNGGFVLISHAIERISGLTLGDFMRLRIFEPIGMYDTLLRRRDTDFVPGSATMHMTLPDGVFVKSYVGGDRSGTGGIVSTVNDMLRWLAHMNAPIIGSRETWVLMTTPQSLANGSSTGYGFGLARDVYRDLEVLQHSGGGMGANAHVLKVPSIGLDLAIMVNRHDVSSQELCLNVLDACMAGKSSHKPGNALGACGTFHSVKTGRVIRLYVDGGQQFAGIAGYVDMPFVVGEDGVLRPAMAAPLPYKLSMFLAGDRERPTALRLCDYGNLDEFVRVEPPVNADLRAIAGSYRTDAASFEVTISESGMRAVGPFGSVQYHLSCLAENIWHARGEDSPASFLSAILCFERAGFHLWSYCARALPFLRVD